MLTKSQGEILLEHLERYLGPAKNRWRGKGGNTMPFEVFVFSGQPEFGDQCLVTFGLSAHRLQVVGQGDRTIRMELAICTNSSFDSKALGALLFAVGLDALDRHATPGCHGVLPGSGAVLSGGNPIFQHLYLTSPGYFPPGFKICRELEPAVEIIQVIPISSMERDTIDRKGWGAFEDGVIEQGVDLLEFDRRREVGR